MCSTPFGVMVGFTCGRMHDLIDAGMMCSTPFGVMVGFT